MINGFWDFTLFSTIAALYNMLIHSVASFLYKDMQFEDKHNNTVAFIFIAGIIGIIIAKLIVDRNKNNYLVSRGFYIGGIMLILTSVIVNWNHMAEEMKLLFMAAGLGFAIWFATYKIGYNKQTTDAKLQNNQVNVESEDIKSEDITAVKSEDIAELFANVKIDNDIKNDIPEHFDIEF